MNLISRHLKEFISLIKFVSSVNKLYKYIKKNNLYGSDLDKKVILINLVRTYNAVQISAEIYFALLFKMRGANVYILYDDGILLSQDTEHIESSRFKKTLKYFRNKIFSLPIFFCDLFIECKVKYSNLLRGHNYDKQYQGLEHHITSSLARYYLSSTDAKSVASEKSYYEDKDKLTENAYFSYNTALAADKKYKPDFILSSHGIYSTWGPFFEYFKSKNTTTICYEYNCFNPGTIDISFNDLASTRFDLNLFTHFNEFVSSNNLHSHVEEISVKIIADRMQYKSKDQDLFDNKVLLNKQDDLILKKLKNIESGNHVVGIFPNLLWDNATTFKHLNTVFTSVTEWLIETVSTLLEKKNITVVLRIHPAERGGGKRVRKGVYEIISENLPDALNNSNLIIVQPDDKFSSYTLFEYLDVATIYNGTIGYELLANEIPTIVSSKAPFSECINAPRDKLEYFTMLNTKNFSDLKINYRKFYALIFYYFNLHAVDFSPWGEGLYSTSNGISHSDLVAPDMLNFIQVLTGDKNFLQEYNMKRIFTYK